MIAPDDIWKIQSKTFEVQRPIRAIEASLHQNSDNSELLVILKFQMIRSRSSDDLLEQTTRRNKKRQLDGVKCAVSRLIRSGQKTFGESVWISNFESESHWMVSKSFRHL